MRLIVHNQEIHPHSAAFPEVEAFRAVCQLIGVPFREDERAAAFAVYPPLLGKRVLIESRVKSDAMWLEVDALGRLLRLCGADVTLRAAGAISSDRTSQYDVNLIIYEAPACGVEPTLIHSWWRRPLRNRKLAGGLAAAIKDAIGVKCSRRTKCTRWPLPQETKSWSRQLSGSCEPCVLICLTQTVGLAFAICQGLMYYFDKPQLDSTLRDVLQPVASQPIVGSASPQRATAVMGVAKPASPEISAGTRQTSSSSIDTLNKAIVPGDVGESDVSLPDAEEEELGEYLEYIRRKREKGEQRLPKPTPGSGLPSPETPKRAQPMEKEQSLDGAQPMERQQWTRSARSVQPEKRAQRKERVEGSDLGAADRGAGSMAGSHATANVDPGNVREIMAIPPKLREELVAKYLASKGVVPSEELVAEYMEYLKSIAEQLEEFNQ
ncbi:MAG TPA: hypothetical protein GXX40_02235 [Firmicutes bacterium]|nr:hypothetical protein [Bacillota bacterium]